MTSRCTCIDGGSPWVFAVGFLVLLLHGCIGTDDVELSAGSNELGLWTVDEDLLIGVDDEQEEYQFGRIADVDVASDGRIYVLDAFRHQVLVYDADGVFGFAFGGFGEGPGELSGVLTTVLIGRGDTVLVAGPNMVRAHRFTSDGVNVGFVSSQMNTTRWSVLPSGEYIEYHRPSLAQIGGHLILRNPDGDRMENVVDFPLIPAQQLVRTDATPRLVVNPLHPVPEWATTSDGRIVLGNTAEAELLIQSVDGREVTTIDLGEPPPALTASEQRNFRDAMPDVMRRSGMAEDAIQQTVAQIEFNAPPVFPRFVRIVGADDGTIWVQKPAPIDSLTFSAMQNPQDGLYAAGSMTWEVVSPDDGVIARLQLPPETTVHRVKNGFIHGVQRGEYGVQHVVRLRIVR